MTQPISSPPGLPLLGNIADIAGENTIASLIHLAGIYGSIFKLKLGGKDRVFISSRDLVDEVCDESRFVKNVSGALEQVRNGVHDGLFTAYPGEHNWEVAHRVLMPAFGPLSIQSMFDEMHDIASQLVTKWARYGPDSKIDVTDDFTRLTLDSIALCAMDTRFNSFYKEDLHPFVHAMVGFLTESGLRAQRPGFANYFMGSAQFRYHENIKVLHSVAQEAVQYRRAHPTDKKDLLNAMLNGRDPKTGEGLSDDSIYNNMITFLIAGHETTSGMLSFLFQFLLKSPAAYQAAQREVDAVIGRGPVTIDHMSKLPYITACLRETLRLCPTAAVWTVTPVAKDKPTIIGGKYEILPGQAVIALLAVAQRDPKVFGENANAFMPERMLDEEFNKLPENSWKPFGNGVRACIGRPFAWQEALLATAMLLQNFNFRLHDPSYQLQIRQTLTIKPKDFYMHATLREGMDPIQLERSLFVGDSSVKAKNDNATSLASNSVTKSPMSIFYGSNTGTCEALAQALAKSAAGRGFDAKVETLDTAVGNVPKNLPVIIITASYEGEPPDNAAHFLEWLTKTEGSDFEGIQYAVFGCGHRDWQATFQKIPKLTDKLLEEHGANRLAERGYADAAAGSMFNDFDRWEDEVLWPAIKKNFGGSNDEPDAVSGLDVEINPSSRRSYLNQDVQEAIVTDVKVLTGEKESAKRHVEIKLPTGMVYNAGDYLAVLPLNHAQTVRRVLKRFGLAWDAGIVIKPGQSTILPMDRQISVFDILTAYVELSQPATHKNVLAISRAVTDETSQKALAHLLGPAFTSEITEKRTSPLDLLERFLTAELPFGSFLSMLPPMRIRQYSISSSPLVDPSICTLTFSVLDQEALVGGKRHLGVASNYLSILEKQDRIHVAVKPSHQAFHPPLDVANTPLVMVCAGTGIAPFRGFVMERAKQIEAGRKLAPALLFYGCRNADTDNLYKDEFAKWQESGAVDVRRAFSREPEKSEGCKYVQDRVYKDRKDAVDLFEAGAKVYVCGSSGVGEGVREVVKKIFREKANECGKPRTDDEVEKWFDGIRNERYASDVFA